MAESVAEEYKSSLADLSCNSKPLINMLTILAEENIKYAPEIVKTIADHVLEVSPECKLPCLYLIDSIIKNVRQQYLSLFSQNIVQIFASVFEKVEETTRMLLYKLRQTWNEIFPNKILYNLDMRVKEVDPAWPVTAQPPPQSIHINPKFLGSSNVQQKPSETPVLERKEEAKLKAKQNEVLQQLIAKQEQLRRLEERKEELKKQFVQSDATYLVAPPVPTTQPQTIDPRIVAKLNPRLRQRDPRLQKVQIASVLKKNLTQEKPNVDLNKETAQTLPAAASALNAKVAIEPPVSVAATRCDKSVSKPPPIKKDLPKENSKPNVAEPNNVKTTCVTPPSDPRTDRKAKLEKEDLKREQTSPLSPLKKKRKKSNEPKSEESLKESSPKKSPKGKGGKKNDSPKKSTEKVPDSSGHKRQGRRSRSPVHKSDKKTPGRAEHSMKDKKAEKDEDGIPSKHFDRRLKKVEKKEGDTDLRKINRDQESRNKREAQDDVKENFGEPPEKKGKEEIKEKCAPDSLFGHEDQDYRQLSKDGKLPHHKGWAMYKAAHPDEFKPTRRSSLHGRDLQNRHSEYEELPRINNENSGPRPFREIFDHGPVEFDRLGRPRLHRMRRNERFGFVPVHYEREAPLMYPDRMPPSEKHFNDLFLSVLGDPKDMLRQAEERFRLGRISEKDYNELRRDLERMPLSADYRKDFDRKNFGGMFHGDHGDRMKGRNLENMHPPFHDGPPQGHGIHMPTAVRTFRLDNKSRRLHFIDDRAIVLMDNGEPRELTFRGDPTPVFIQGLKPIFLRFGGSPVEFELDGKISAMKFGTPSRELYINNCPYEAKFGGPPFDATINGRVYQVRLGGPPPQVQVSEHPVHELYHKFLDLSQGNPDLMPLPGPPEALRDHSNKIPFDVDMRSEAVNRKGDLRDMDWRHSSVPPDAGESLHGYDFHSNGAPPFHKDHPMRSDRKFQMQDCNQWDNSENPDIRVFPPDQMPPRNPEWMNFPQQFHNLNRTRHSPPPGPPGEWNPPHHPPVSRAFDAVDKSAFEPLPRPWPPMDFNHEGPRMIRPPVSEPGNLYPSGQRNSPNQFEPFAGFHEGEPGVPPPPQFPMPMMPRPPFNPHQTRPDFIERPPVSGRLPRPPLPPPWMNAPRSLAPVENRLPALPPPPQPPLHMRMPDPFVRPKPPSVVEPRVEQEVTNTSTPLFPASTTTAPAAAVQAETGSTREEKAVTENTTGAATNPPATSLAVTIDVSTLFEKLVAAGIISKAKAEPVPQSPAISEKDNKESEVKEEKDIDPNEETIPPISLKMASLKLKYSGVVSALYRGSQCASCGMRFKEIHGERYSRHLDWHFRVNRREKDGVKKAFSRKWFYEVEDWIQFEEFEDIEVRARSYFELQATEQFQTEEKNEAPSVPALGRETEACFVCGELFQLFWVEEEEEWHLKNAVREEGQAYHPSCYEDFKKATETSAKEAEEKNAVTTPAASETEMVPIKEEPVSEGEVTEEHDSVIAEVVQMLADATVQSYEEAEAKAVKVEEETKDEVEEMKVEEEPMVVVKEEPHEEEVELQGKPGEEEIIGVIAEADLVPECEPAEESEKVVFESGGIIMKVRAESLKPASPLTEGAAVKETAKDAVEECEEELEFRPPTPDPRFQVLPPVQRGTELSGLCTIM